MALTRIDPQAFTGGSVFIEGSGYAGALKSFEPPKIEFETIEANSSIGKQEIVLPTLKPLNAKVSFQAVNKMIFSLLKKGKLQKIVVKANASSSGETGAITDTAVHATMEGNIKSAEPPKFEMSKELEISVEMSVSKYTYAVGGEEMVNYDIFTATCKLVGEDQFTNIRNNIS
ncbi:phage major tail tube protein [Helicobacter felis]|uniref:phage major tail tube protein n=1 Tax=Helicobacter felis TaxID=214 RepID=UPI000CF07293|nr:phage major tail tube protein [Helicobacter felis]